MMEHVKTIRAEKRAVCMPDRDIIRGTAKRFGGWWNWKRVSLGQKRLLGDAVWVASGQIASAAGLLLGMRCLTEFVPPEVFGTVSLLIGIGMFGSDLFCYPQLEAAVRFYPELARKKQVGLLRVTTGQSLRRTCAALMGLILIGGAFWSYWTGLSYGVFVALVVLLMSGVFSTFETGLLGAARRQRAVAIWRIVESCARPGLGLLAVLAFGVTPTALLAGYAAATTGILLVFRVSSPWGGAETVSADEERRKALAEEIRRYAKPLILWPIVGWINALSDRYILGGLAGPEQVGIYAAAYGLINRPFLMGGGMLIQTLRPVYYEAIAGGNRAVEQRTLRLLVRLTILLCIVGVLGVSCLREGIAELLLGPKYRSAAAIMPILAAGFSFMTLSQVFQTICLAHKRTRSALWSESGGAVGMIVFGVPLIALLGLRGAAIATAGAYAIQALLAIYLSRLAAKEIPVAATKRI